MKTFGGNKKKRPQYPVYDKVTGEVTVLNHTIDVREHMASGRFSLTPPDGGPATEIEKIEPEVFEDVSIPEIPEDEVKDDTGDEILMVVEEDAPKEKKRTRR